MDDHSFINLDKEVPPIGANDLSRSVEMVAVAESKYMATPAVIPGVRTLRERPAIFFGPDTAVSTILRAAWEQTGMSQHEIARRMGVSPQSVNQYLSAKKGMKIPSLKWILKFLAITGGRIRIEF